MTTPTGFERPPFATVLVVAVRHKLRTTPKRRLIRNTKCCPVQPPADFAQAIAEVLTPDRVPTVRNMADCEDEHIGEEFSTRPFLW